jgi:SAM-dependent MidA family methyltransferase
VDPFRGSEPRLVERIREEILAAPAGRISFARFMAMALTEPGLGYYATSRERPSRAGDFLTAPELHPFFGRLVSRFLADVWVRMGSPATFTVREDGAGGGTLERAVMAGAEHDAPTFARALDWQPMDLGHAEPQNRVVGAIVANEFLDALPVHRVVVRDGKLRELFVTWNDDRFAEVEAEPSVARLASTLEDDGVSLQEGQIAEVGLAAIDWAERLGARLEAGVALVMDYSLDAAELYAPRRRGGTLVTYRDQQPGDDPFAVIGRQDLTAHVNVTAVSRAARGAGLQVLGDTTQARFLMDLGLQDLLEEARASVDAEAYLLARSAVLRLLDPRHLGGFRVLACGRGFGATPRLRGFRSAEG